MEADLIIVHPCYNPGNNWERHIVKCIRFIAASLPENISIGMVLVNDGSDVMITKQQVMYLQQHITNFKYIHHQVNSGKGSALRSGVKEIKSGLIICTDLDYPYRLENLIEMFIRLRQGNCDVIVGVRTSEYYRQLPVIRKFFSLLLKRFNYIFFPGMFVKDTQSGLKGFNQAGKQVFLKTAINGFLFEPEFIRLCEKEKLKMQQISLYLSEGIVMGKMNWRIVLKEAANYFKLIVKG